MKSDQQPHHRHHHPPPPPPPPPPPQQQHHHTPPQPHPHITNPYSSQSAATLTTTASSSHNSSFSSADEHFTTNEAFYTSLCCFTNLSPTKMSCLITTFHIPTLCILSLITIAFFSSDDAPSTPNFWIFDNNDGAAVQPISLSNGSAADQQDESAVNKTYKAILLALTICMYGYICIKSGDKLEGVWTYEQRKRNKICRQRLLEEEYEAGLSNDDDDDDFEENAKDEYKKDLHHREVLNERTVSGGSLTNDDEENEEDEYLDNEPHDAHLHSSSTTTASSANTSTILSTKQQKQQKVKRILSPILYYTLFYLSFALCGSILSLHIFTTCDEDVTEASSSSSAASCQGSNTKMRIQSLSMYLLVSLPLFLTSLYFLLPFTDKSKILSSFKKNKTGAITGPSGAALYVSVDLAFSCFLLLLHPGGGGRNGKDLLWCSFVISSIWIYVCWDVGIWVIAANVRKKEKSYRNSLEEEHRRRRNMRRRGRGWGRRVGRKERFTLVANEDDEEESEKNEKDGVVEEDAFQDDETKKENQSDDEEFLERIVIAGANNNDDDEASTSSPLSPALIWSFSLTSINFFFTLLDLAYNGGRTILGESTISTINNDLIASEAYSSLYSQNMSLTFGTFVLYSALLLAGITITANYNNNNTSIPKLCGLGGIIMILVRVTYFCLYGEKDSVTSAKMMVSSFFIYILAFVEVGCVLWYDAQDLQLFLVQRLQYWSLSRKIWDRIVMKFIRDRKRWIEEELAAAAAEEEEDGNSDSDLRVSGGSGGSGGGEGGDNQGVVVAGSVGTRGRQNWWKRRPSSLDLMSYLLNKDEEEKDNEQMIDYDETNNDSPWKYPAVDAVAEEGLVLEDDEDIKDLVEDEIKGDDKKDADTVEIV